MTISIALVLGSLITAAPSPAAASPSAEVQKLWYDGQAELAGYRLTQPRYGQLRKGSVVLVYVTEPFSKSDRVKAEDPRRPPSDVFSVLKLNVAKDFQTGIYDYNVMTSVFVGMQPEDGVRAGAPTKLTFSMQEWCGMVFEQLLFDEGAMRHQRFSYFDGEDQKAARAPRPEGGVTVDELPILVRSLPVPFLKPGTSVALPMLPRLESLRMQHRPLAWQDGRLSRGATSETKKVPAGTFQTEVWTAELGRDRYRYWVEIAFPHRLVAWEGPNGEQAVMLGNERMPYWSLHDEGHERFLKKLGLSLPQRP